MTTTRTPTTDTKRLMATRASIRGSIEKDFSAGTQRVTDIDAEAAGFGSDEMTRRKLGGLKASIDGGSRVWCRRKESNLHGLAPNGF
jgi:hypothetical protein